MIDRSDLLPDNARPLGGQVRVVQCETQPAANIPDPFDPDGPVIEVPARLLLGLRFPAFTIEIRDVPAETRPEATRLIEQWRALGTPVGVYAVRYNDLCLPPQDPELRRVTDVMWVLRLIDEQGGYVDAPVGEPVIGKLTMELQRREEG
jgi:hypothetical protein